VFIVVCSVIAIGQFVCSGHFDSDSVWFTNDIYLHIARCTVSGTAALLSFSGNFVVLCAAIFK